jgi:hypothetical protein
VVFIVSRVAFAVAGVGFDDSAVHPGSATQVQWQLLPTHLLRHDLLRSVWYLHSQPPLYNLFVGFLLHLPGAAVGPVAASVFVGLGLLMVFACYGLLAELGLPPWAAATVAAAVAIDPATVLYENWLSWTYPSAALLITGAFGSARLVCTGRRRWALLAASCFAGTVLLDTTYQWPWLLAVLAVLGWGVRHQWRRALAGAAVPIVLVAGWYGRGAVLFGTATTSSWAGMNLAQITVFQAPPGQVSALVANHTLSDLATVPPFAPPSRYVPHFARVKDYGVAALDEEWSEDGVPNYDNSIYLRLGPRYLSDSLSYVAAEPGTYAGDVQRSVQVWLVPSDQYFALRANYRQISGYARIFDTVALLQPTYGGPQAGTNAELRHQPPGPGSESWGLVLVMLVVLVGAPAVLYRQRGADPAATWVGTVMWLTVVYSFAVTSLTSLGENNRFRFEMGPIPVALLALVILILYRPVLGPHRPRRLAVRRSAEEGGA